MFYLGIDVGSVSTDLVVMDQEKDIKHQLYLKTQGDPVGAVLRGLSQLSDVYASKQIAGVGATGSGRAIAGALAGADVVKNEITTHGTAAAAIDKEFKTVLEIGGQDSKIILLQDGLVADFAMNTVCAAGTGAFLDRQAERMGMTIEEFSCEGLAGKKPTRIAGRCAVFAESDIIHKQQQGIPRPDIIAGTAQALVRNYMSNVAKGKKILPKVCFQGGVSENLTIRKAFEDILGMEVIVPKYNKVMGAFGAAIMAQRHMELKRTRNAHARTLFKGFEMAERAIEVKAFPCGDCSNNCEVTIIMSDGKPFGCISDRCGKYQTSVQQKASSVS